MLRVSFIRLWSVEGLVIVVAQSDVCVVVTAGIPTYTHTGRCGGLQKSDVLHCACVLYLVEKKQVLP